MKACEWEASWERIIRNPSTFSIDPRATWGSSIIYTAVNKHRLTDKNSTPLPDSNQLAIHQHQTTRARDQPSVPPGLTAQTFSPCTFILRVLFLFCFLAFELLRVTQNWTSQSHELLLLEPAKGSLLVSIKSTGTCEQTNPLHHFTRHTISLADGFLKRKRLLRFKLKPSNNLLLMTQCPNPWSYTVFYFNFLKALALGFGSIDVLKQFLDSNSQSSAHLASPLML